MGNQKQKWKAEEEEALRAGVAKHGTGKWKNILRDPEFAPFLTLRSNIDLKVPKVMRFLFYLSSCTNLFSTHMFTFSIVLVNCTLFFQYT